jgi:hypothetical protein
VSEFEYVRLTRYNKNYEYRRIWRIDATIIVSHVEVKNLALQVQITDITQPRKPRKLSRPKQTRADKAHLTQPNPIKSNLT